MPVHHMDWVLSVLAWRSLAESRRVACGSSTPAFFVGGADEGLKKIMNDAEVLRTVDAIHRDKNIDKEIVFEVLEQAILSAARKHYGEETPL